MHGPGAPGVFREAQEHVASLRALKDVGSGAVDDGHMNLHLTILWLLLGAYMVFFMQLGFALLEAGSVRAKNTKNILLKNVVDACAGGIIWWGWGMSFAYGPDGVADNAFIGGNNFFMSKDTELTSSSLYAGWMFQWAFAAAAATIVSGAVAERCRFGAYLVYSCVITGFIYPVAVHWGWSSEGWLSAWHSTGEPTLGANGLIDFAGSGVVHMTGGGAALMGAIMLGPRIGRFDASGACNDLPGHSTVLATMGCFILWFGWYGFNPVSTLYFSYMDLAEKVAVTTTIAAAAGGLTVLGFSTAMGNPLDVAPALNGILAGLVSITAPCPICEPYGAFFIGVIGGFVYYGASKMLKMMKIDDPLDASPVHFFCGAWGVVSAGLFATEFMTGRAYGFSADDYGLFYGGGGKQFGIQLLGTAAFAVWTCSTSGLMFFILKTINFLRVPESEELAGLDESHHGGAAYDFAKPGTY